MIVNDTKTIVKKTTLIVWSFCICLFAFATNCIAQNNDKEIDIHFAKPDEMLAQGQMYFNVVKLFNRSTKPISGSLIVNAPEKWSVLSFATDELVLPPGDTLSIPVRISPTATSQGGISYLVSAQFRSSQQQVSATAYISFPAMANWDFAIDKTTAYFTEKNRNAVFRIKLTNKGNTNELIKLRLEAGKLLSFSDNTASELVEYIRLKAFSDTIISRTITSQEKISFADRLRYENNWKESAIRISASTELTEKSGAIQISRLKSTYVNQRAQSSSPLNLDYQAYNLMSNQGVRHNARAYGSVLFPGNGELQYLAGMQNFSTADKMSNFDMQRQLIYNLRYTDNHNNIQVGYNVNGGSLHSVNGRGLTGALRIGKKTNIAYALTQNPYSDNLGANIGLSQSIKRINLSAEMTHERNPSGFYQANSALFGLGFTLFRNHNFSLQLLGSKADYRKNIPSDTSVMGFSYRASYNIQTRKFAFRISTMNSERNFIQNAGFKQNYLDGRYMLNDKISFQLYGTQQNYALTRYPYNFYHPISFNRNENLRFSTSIYAGGIQYQFGPTYNGSVRESYDMVKAYKSAYLNYQPGLWCAATIRFSGYKTITPNLTVSNIRFYYRTDNPMQENYSFNKNVYYSAGVNYFDNVWRVNAFYTSGSATDLYRSVQVDSKPVVSRSVQFRPSYENYFFNRKVKLSAYVNYAYYMPSGRENVSYNLKYDHYFKIGWDLTVSGYMYANTRVDEERGRISSKDMNVFIGIRKSFNIQQPRLKYYDYKAILFNDLNGDRKKGENEPPVSDVLVTVEKDKQAIGPSHMQEVKLVSDATGSISIENLPRDQYKIAFNPLEDINSLYFLNGSVQQYLNDKSRTVYIPLAESYKIKGRINLTRDPNSSEGKIDLNGIRITATAENGETYSVLTDNFGGFILGVPNADKYTVHINNVLGENFSIDNNEIQVQFTQSKSVQVEFNFIEKTRSIQFEGGQFFNFNSLGKESETAAESQNIQTKQPEESEKVYSIQLAALKSYRNPDFFKTRHKLSQEVLYTESNGLYKYYTGMYNSLPEARANIDKLGLRGVQAFSIDRVDLKKGREAVVSSSTTALKKSATSTNQNTLSSSETASFFTKTTDTQSETKELSQQSVDGTTEQAPATSSIVNPSNASNKNTIIKQTQDKTTNKKTQTTAKAQQSNLNSESTAKSETQATAPSNKKNEKASATPSVVSKQTQSVNNPLETEKSTQAGTIVSNIVKEPKINFDGTKQVSELKSTKQPENSQPKTEIPVVSKTPAKTQIEPKGTIKQQANKTEISEKTNKAIENPAIEEKTTSSSTGEYAYTIRLDAPGTYRSPSYYKQKYNLPYEVRHVQKGRQNSYYAGKFKTEDEAMAEIARYGIAGYIVSLSDLGSEKK